MKSIKPIRGVIKQINVVFCSRSFLNYSVVLCEVGSGRLSKLMVFKFSSMHTKSFERKRYEIMKIIAPNYSKQIKLIQPLINSEFKTNKLTNPK